MRYFYFFVVLVVLFSCSKNKERELFVESTGNIYYEKAWNFFDLKKNDSAFAYFNKAKDLYGNQNDSIGVAKCLLNMAIIQSDYCDYYGSQENAVESIKIFTKKKDSVYISTNYNLLGTNEIRLENFERSIDYLTKAISLTNNTKEKNTFLNNKAIAFAKMENYDSSFSILRKLSQQHIGNISQYRDNYFYFKWKQNPSYNALFELLDALKTREKEDDLWGQNASHAHLSDYFFEDDKVKSLFHAKKMFVIAKQLESPDDQLEALQKLIYLESPKQSKIYFNSYQKLNDSIQTARSKAKNQFALIRYETEKARSENIESQNHILKQYFIIVVLIIVLVFGFLLNRRRKKKLQQAKEIEVKNTQIKYSKKVHDVVANGLYHTMMQIQNNSAFGKEQMLNNIEKLYEESRDIARDDLNEIYEKDFSVRLAEMLNSYSNETNKVFIVGNSPEKWETITNNVQTEILYTLRECMINMMKHSKAKLVSVKFEKSEDFLMIKYTDNGVGIDDVQKKSTSGIRNMENRIVTIGGKITFEKNPANGLIIQITIPT